MVCAAMDHDRASLAQVRSSPPLRCKPDWGVPAPIRERGSSFDKGKLSLFRRRSTGEVETPFDVHLKDVYLGLADEKDGLTFFETWGYYDVAEANTVAMFRQNFGLDVFWEETSASPLAEMQALYLGKSLLKSFSERFDKAGDTDPASLNEEQQLESTKDVRLKARSLELDDEDMAQFEREQKRAREAVAAIRTEKTRFKRYFAQAFDQESRQSPQNVVLPQPSPTINVQLPPYSGYVYQLKDTIPHLLRSWHKRWFYLDFGGGIVMMFKRSYWKSIRGVIDLRHVARVLRTNACDIRIEFVDDGMMLLRTKLPEEAELWVNLLKFAKRQILPDESNNQLIRHLNAGSVQYGRKQLGFLSSLLEDRSRVTAA